MMTLNEFLLDFGLAASEMIAVCNSPDDTIRLLSDEGEHCPLTAVCYLNNPDEEIISIPNAFLAGEMLDLPDDLIRTIMSSADGDTDVPYYAAAVRARLLEVIS